MEMEGGYNLKGMYVLYCIDDWLGREYICPMLPDPIVSSNDYRSTSSFKNYGFVCLFYFPISVLFVPAQTYKYGRSLNYYPQL